MSIIKCGANEQTFITMITDALARQNTTLYLKLHPDTISGERGGYFKLPAIQSLIASNPNRFVMIDYEANPLDTIKQVDAVYCVSSQLGFEAMMCNKEVHIYGKPIYLNNLTLEEFFYIFYIKNTMWIDPYTNKMTDIYTFLNNFTRLLNDKSC
jgi:capsular polysaccharide export protein